MSFFEFVFSLAVSSLVSATCTSLPSLDHLSVGHGHAAVRLFSQPKVHMPVTTDPGLGSVEASQADAVFNGPPDFPAPKKRVCLSEILS